MEKFTIVWSLIVSASHEMHGGFTIDSARSNRRSVHTAGPVWANVNEIFSKCDNFWEIRRSLES